MAKFESQERRMPKIEACLKANGLESLDACREMLLSKGIDVDAIVKGVQPICFENAVWAYTLGTAIAVKRGLKSAADCAAAIGEGLEAFTIPGSVAEQRAVGLGHGNLGAMLLRDETKCFAFLAGHESFAAAGGHGEVFFAVLHRPFFIGAGNQVLEAGGVGRVARDGHLNALLLHNGNALEHVVGAVALHRGAFAVGKSLLAHDLQLAGLEVVIRLHIGEAVDAADDLGGILAQAVQDHAQRLLTGLILSLIHI